MKKFFIVYAFALFLTGSFKANAQDHVIVHTVEQGQTIYSISRLYNVTPTEIKDQNPLVDDSYAIKPGQIIRIEMKETEKADSLLSKMEKQPIHHTVQSKETLYGISKDHSIKLDDIKLWNNLGDSQIKVGQQLIVGWRYTNQQKTSTVVEQTQVVNQSVVTQPISPNNSDAVNSSPIIKQEPVTVNSSTTAQPVSTSTDKQALLRERFISETANKSFFKQSGPAIFFSTDNQMLSTRYYGLFSDAPIGSIVKVQNLINNQVTYVKVIGSLPNTKENHGSMIKLTTAAKNSLSAIDGKIRVEVTYVK